MMNDISKSIKDIKNNPGSNYKYLKNFKASFFSMHNKSTQISEYALKKKIEQATSQPKDYRKQNRINENNPPVSTNKQGKEYGRKTLNIFRKYNHCSNNQIKYHKSSICKTKQNRMVHEWITADLSHKKQAEYSVLALVQIDMTINLLRNRIKILQNHQETLSGIQNNKKTKQINKYIKAIQRLTEFRTNLLNKFKKINLKSSNFGNKKQFQNIDQFYLTKQAQEPQLILVQNINTLDKQQVNNEIQEFKQKIQGSVPKIVNIQSSHKVLFSEFLKKSAMHSPFKNKPIKYYDADMGQIEASYSDKLKDRSLDKIQNSFTKQVACMKKILVQKPKYLNKALQYAASANFLNKKNRSKIALHLSHNNNQNLSKQQNKTIENQNHDHNKKKIIKFLKKNHKKRNTLLKQKLKHKNKQKEIFEDSDEKISENNQSDILDYQKSQIYSSATNLDLIQNEIEQSYSSSNFTEQQRSQRQSELHRIVMENMFNKRITNRQNDISQKKTTMKFTKRGKKKKKTTNDSIISRKADKDTEDIQLDILQLPFKPYTRTSTNQKTMKGKKKITQKLKYQQESNNEISIDTSVFNSNQIFKLKNSQDEAMTFQQQKILNYLMKSQQFAYGGKKNINVNKYVSIDDAMDRHISSKDSKDSLMKNIQNERQKQRLRKQMQARIKNFRNQFQEHYTPKVNIQNKTSFCSLFWKGNTTDSLMINQGSFLDIRRPKFLQTTFSKINRSKNTFENQDFAQINFAKAFNRNYNKIKQIGLMPSSDRKSRSFHAIN